MKSWLPAAVWLAATNPKGYRRMDETRYRLWKNEEGATSVEYALIASLIAGVIGLVVSAIGGKVLNMFTVGAAMFP